MLNKLLIPALSITGLALSGCATQQITSYPDFIPTAIGQNQTQKTDTLFVILDASASKNNIFDGNTSGNTKFDVQKQFLSQMNQTIPANIKLNSGIRNFGFGSCLNWGSTNLLQATSPYSSEAFQSSLDKANCASGGSPMESALTATEIDLNNTPGNIALLVISDGHQISPTATEKTKALKAKFGDSLCIYSVWVGNKNEQAGEFFLQELSNIAGCGQTENINQLNSSASIAAFTENMLFKKSTPIKVMPPADDDKDGVLNTNDQCPHSPIGATVNAEGCWSLSGLKFNSNKASIKAGYQSLLANALSVLKQNLSITIQIEGHTDSQGATIYNQALSARRANTVRTYFIENGIDANRLTAKGFGEETPIADNTTAEGRELNRRVNLNVTHR